MPFRGGVKYVQDVRRTNATFIATITETWADLYNQVLTCQDINTSRDIVERWYDYLVITLDKPILFRYDNGELKSAFMAQIIQVTSVRDQLVYSLYCPSSYWNSCG